MNYDGEPQSLERDLNVGTVRTLYCIIQYTVLYRVPMLFRSVYYYCVHTLLIRRCIDPYGTIKRQSALQ